MRLYWPLFYCHGQTLVLSTAIRELMHIDHIKVIEQTQEETLEGITYSVTFSLTFRPPRILLGSIPDSLASSCLSL